MAVKGVKKIKTSGVISQAIEEFVDVPFKIVGTPQWLSTAITPYTRDEIYDKTITIHRVSDMDNIYADLDAHIIHGLDTETGGPNILDGLKPHSKTSKILLFQYGTQDMVYVCDPSLIQYFKRYLQSDEFLKLLQNGVHDFKFLMLKENLLLKRIYDSMLAEQVIVAGLPGVRVGLDVLSRKYPPHYIINKEVRNEFLNLQEPMEYRHLFYAARDVYVMFPVMRGEQPEITKHKLNDVCQIEFNCIPVTAEIETTGVHLDEKILRLAVSYYERKATRIYKRVMEIYNQKLTEMGRKPVNVLPGMVEEFDIDSNDVKMEVLKMLGIDVENVKRETLKQTGEELAMLLGEYTECTKVISTYGEQLLAKREPNGRFYPEFHQLGVGEMRGAGADSGKKSTIATGRYSSDFQQLPRSEHILDPIDDPKELAAIEQQFAEGLAKARKELHVT